MPVDICFVIPHSKQAQTYCIAVFVKHFEITKQTTDVMFGCEIKGLSITRINLS